MLLKCFTLDLWLVAFHSGPHLTWLWTWFGSCWSWLLAYLYCIEGLTWVLSAIIEIWVIGLRLDLNLDFCSVGLELGLDLGLEGLDLGLTVLDFVVSRPKTWWTIYWFGTQGLKTFLRGLLVLIGDVLVLTWALICDLSLWTLVLIWDLAYGFYTCSYLVKQNLHPTPGLVDKGLRIYIHDAFNSLTQQLHCALRLFFASSLKHVFFKNMSAKVWKSSVEAIILITSTEWQHFNRFEITASVGVISLFSDTRVTITHLQTRNTLTFFWLESVQSQHLVQSFPGAWRGGTIILLRLHQIYWSNTSF